jgi:hypothetical protein
VREEGRVCKEIIGGWGGRYFGELAAPR